MAYTQNKSTAKNQPVDKIKRGAITGVVWENVGTNAKTGQGYSFRSYQFNRSYKNDKGEWQNTDSFRKQDLPYLLLAVQQAWEDATTKTEANNTEEQQ